MIDWPWTARTLTFVSGVDGYRLRTEFPGFKRESCFGFFFVFFKSACVLAVLNVGFLLSW